MSIGNWSRGLAVFAIVWSSAAIGAPWSSETHTLVVGDFDADNRDDLLYIAKDVAGNSGIALSDGNGPNTLWQSWPSNHLGIPWHDNLYIPIVADFNGDGRDDLLMQAASPANSYLIHTDSQGRISGISQTIPYSYLGQNWTADQHRIVAGDFNGDGKADLFLQGAKKDLLNAVYFADGSGTFTSGPAQTWGDSYMGLRWTLPSAIVHAGYFDSDTKADLFVQAKPDIVIIDYDIPFPVPSYRSLSFGIAKARTSAECGSTNPLFCDPALQRWNRNWQGADWSAAHVNAIIGDYNGDGRMDIFLQSRTSARSNQLMLADGNGQINSADAILDSNVRNWTADQYTLRAGNFDGSGGTGLYLQTTSASGSNYIAPTVSAASAGTTGHTITQPTPATALGRTAGTVAVSPNGAAQYTIPLWNPPGINGLQPSIALQYSSESGNGPVGMGWSITGLSAITRCIRTWAQDGAPGPVELTANDRFCLDGNRLRSTTGVYGSAGSTYQTELETFARITAVGTVANGNGPQSFTVEQKSGLIYEYGGTSDSRIEAGGGATATVRTWALSKIRDRAGNSIQFSYIEDTVNKTYRISEIAYPYTATGGGPYYKVQFVYEPRAVADTQTFFVGGYQATENSRLDRIDISWNNTVWQLVKRYDLFYELASATKRTRLSAVQECAPSSCLAPTSITYQDGTVGLSNELSMANPDYWMGTLLSDINGDGRQDFLYQNTSTNTFWVMMANGTGFDPAYNTYGPVVDYKKVLLLDYDSDGRGDLLVPNSSNNWRALISNGTTFNIDDTVGIGDAVIPASGADSNAWVADYNSDGRVDLVWAEQTTLKGRLNTGSGFSTTPTTLYTLNSSEQFTATGWTAARQWDTLFRSAVRAADFNGDGRTDLIVRFGYEQDPEINPPMWSFGWRLLISQGASYTVGREIWEPLYDVLIADVNSDGLTDLLYNRNNPAPNNQYNKWTVAFGDGAGGLDFRQTDVPTGTHAGASWAMDWDGDGRADIVQRVNTNYYYYRWNGATFDAGVSIGITEPNNTTSTIGIPRVGDVNGDGLIDWAYSSATSGSKYRLHAGVHADVVRTVTDGFGVAAAFTYLPATNAAVYTKGTGASFPELEVQKALHVVQQMSVTDGTGTGSVRSYNYRYEGMRNNLQRRASLGFGKRIVTDTALGYNQVTEESYLRSFPNTGRLSEAILKQSSGTKIREVTSNWSVLNFGSGSSSRFFPYVSSSLRKAYEVGGPNDGTQFSTVATSVNAIDAYGTITDATTTTTEITTGLNGGSSKSERTYHPSVMNDTTNWCLGRPQQSQEIRSHTQAGGSQKMRTVGRTWSGALCRLEQETTEPGDPAWQAATALFYDAAGNVERTEVTGVGMTTRKTWMDWGVRKQFPESITVAVLAVNETTTLNETTTQGFRYDLGLQTSTTDPNGLATSSGYDAFGRRILETRPDETSTTWTISKCVGCESRIRYEVREEQRRTDSTVFRTDRRYFDQHDRPVWSYSQQADGRESAESVSFDARGRAVTRTLPRWSGGSSNGYSQFSYDSIDRVTSESLYTGSNQLDRATSYAFNGLSTTTTDPKSNQITRYATAWGDVRRTIDAAGGSTNYEHDAFALPTKVIDHYGSVVTSVGYNVRGMKTSSSDMDMGGWTYTPNALGELESQMNANGQTVTFEYDFLGRTIEREEPEGITTWTWGRLSDNTSTNKYIGRLKAVSGPGYGETYVYDNVGRPKSTTITSDAAYQIDYEYNGQGTLDALTYPTSTPGYRFKVAHEYSYGYLSKVKRSDAPYTVYWQLDSVDSQGQVTRETYGNNLQIATAFDPLTGLIDSRQSGIGGGTAVQNLDYAWDKNGNLQRRQDLRGGLNEVFYYDAVNRLDYSTLNGSTNLDLNYDSIGNIVYKSDVGSYTYHTAKKHAVASTSNGWSFGYDANGNMSTRNGSTITWYSYDLPNTINGPSGFSSQFSYAPDRARWKQVANYGGVTESTIYVGSLLEKVTLGSTTSWRHHIQGPGGAIAIYTRQSDSSEETKYLTRDHADSLDSITNSTGIVQVRLSYDAFGRRRNEASWSGNPTSADWSAITPVTRRGYTGHEHLDNLSLIHMNGRVQDPALGRFISADPIIQAPEFSQSLNRYSYVWNNPLSSSDPSGFNCTGTHIKFLCNELGARALHAGVVTGSSGTWEESERVEIHEVDGTVTSSVRYRWVSAGVNFELRSPVRGMTDIYVAQASGGIPIYLTVPSDIAADVQVGVLEGQKLSAEAGLTVAPLPPIVRGIQAFRAWRAAKFLEKLPFKNGDVIVRELSTSKGPLELAAEIQIQGRTLHLKDIAVYPRGAERLNLGVREVAALRQQLSQEARALGFNELRITGVRYSGANPGKQVDVVIDLTIGAP